MVLLFDGIQTDENEGKKVSPDFATESRAEAFATDWMAKHPNGMA